MESLLQCLSREIRVSHKHIILTKGVNKVETQQPKIPSHKVTFELKLKLCSEFFIETPSLFVCRFPQKLGRSTSKTKAEGKYQNHWARVHSYKKEKQNKTITATLSKNCFVVMMIIPLPRKQREDRLELKIYCMQQIQTMARIHIQYKPALKKRLFDDGVQLLLTH